MKASPTFTSVRGGSAAAIPVFAILDVSPDVLATVILAVVAIFAVVGLVVLAAVRPSPNHQYMLDVLSRLEQRKDREPQNIALMPAEPRRMRA